MHHGTLMTDLGYFEDTCRRDLLPNYTVCLEFARGIPHEWSVSCRILSSLCDEALKKLYETDAPGL